MALTINRNRFLSGLSDVSKIVDDGGIPDAPIAQVPPPVLVTVGSSNSGSSGGSANEWLEVSMTATIAGYQQLPLTEEVGSFYSLYINGLRQSQAAFSISGLAVVLPVELEIQPDDIIDFAYIKG